MINFKSCYVHIPFCSKKCFYCDFVTYEKKNEEEKYVSYLLKELDLYKKYNDNILDTLYFGGGTPSLLPPKLLTNIINRFNLRENSEITLEINPEKKLNSNLLDYYKLGINRLSVGCQSFNDEFLKTLGRVHSSKEAINIFYEARTLNFDNINLDLMFALPNQTLKNLKEDLNKLIQLSPEHISIYSLIWKDKTKFHEMRKRGLIDQISEELEYIMYEYIIQFLESNGYLHYEISAFCKKGFEGKHNLTYWNNEKYLGLGMGAAGYLDKDRYLNVKTFKHYYELIDKGIFPIKETELLNEKKELEYSIILSLRLLKKGFSFKKVSSNENLINLYKTKLLNLSKQNLICIVEDNYLLTRKGLFLSNEVFAEIIDC